MGRKVKDTAVDVTGKVKDTAQGAANTVNKKANAAAKETAGFFEKLKNTIIGD